MEELSLQQLAIRNYFGEMLRGGQNNFWAYQVLHTLTGTQLENAYAKLASFRDRALNDADFRAYVLDTEAYVIADLCINFGATFPKPYPDLIR